MIACLKASAKNDDRNCYYECNTKACACSRRVEPIHDQFKRLLGELTLNVGDDMRFLIKEQMIATYNQQNREGDELRTSYKAELKEVDKKLVRLEERYILEEIKRDTFEKYEAKFIEEKKELSIR